MQVTYPPVFQFDTNSSEAADSAQLTEERRAARAPARPNGARRLSLGLALLRGRSAEPERADC